MIDWPVNTAPSAITSDFDVIFPSTLPPRASSALPATTMLPLNLPATVTFWAWISASTWLFGESDTSPSAEILPLTWPSMRNDPADTTVPSSRAPCPSTVTSDPDPSLIPTSAGLIG